MIAKENHFSNVWIEKAVEDFKKSKEKTRRTIAPNPNIEVIWTPMMVGKVAFGRPSNKLIPLYKAELISRGVYSMNEMNNLTCTNLLRAIKDHEHPKWYELDKNEILDKKHEYLKYFSPRYLSAKEWSSEEVDTTLATYFNNNENVASVDE